MPHKTHASHATGQKKTSRQIFRKGERIISEREKGTGDQEYVVDKIVDHGYRDGELVLKVEWYGYAGEDTTWGPIEQLPRSAVVTYFRRKIQPLPPQVERARPG